MPSSSSFDHGRGLHGVCPPHRHGAGALLIALALASCTPAPTIETFHGGGIRFERISTWKIDDNEAMGAGVHLVTLDGPGNAIASLTVLPKGSPMKLADYAQQIDASRAANVEEKLSVGGVPIGSAAVIGAGAPTTIAVGSEQLAGFEQAFSVTLLGQSVPHVALVLEKDLGSLRVLFLVQTPADERATARAGWHKILETLALDGAS